MTNRERLLAVLNFQPYDRLPCVHFGFLHRTIERWRDEGHLTADEAQAAFAGDGSPGEEHVAHRLGFDFNYHTHYAPLTRLDPWFPSRVLEVLPDGKRKVLTGLGTVELNSDDNQSIPAVIDTLLKDRAAWEEQYLPKLQFSPSRVTRGVVSTGQARLAFEPEGRQYLSDPDRAEPCLLHCGTLYGGLRDMVGVEELSYLMVDDPGLFDELIDVTGELSYQCVQAALETGITPDIGHFWEDICFKNGPLINPRVFRAKVGPHYARITALLRQHGINLCSLDSDGKIDELLPIWLENGVNVMFPIEVGTWEADFTPWRHQYGRELRGVGGLDKRIFQGDYATADAEIERLKPIVELGGYLPCPDHRLPQDNRWETVQYFCDRFKATFGPG
ncbi:MAG: hypothetical protein IT204_12810 [Fimbriimonadaceae bacterium]|nr:hypothetical protein [Fimbriimonadaceae bacterium]